MQNCDLIRCFFFHKSNLQDLAYELISYHQTSNISCTLGGNELADLSDVVGASPVGAAPTTSSFSGFHKLGKDDCKTRWKTYKLWDLVPLILEIWWYMCGSQGISRYLSIFFNPHPNEVACPISEISTCFMCLFFLNMFWCVASFQRISRVKDECYKDAIEMLQHISTSFSPAEKLSLIQRTFDEINKVSD